MPSTKKSKKRISKFWDALLSIPKRDRQDLQAFGHLPSNILTQRDREIWDQLLANDLTESEEVIWQRILYQNEASNFDRIKNRLLHTVERYMSFQQMEKNELLRKQLLVEQAIERKRPKRAYTLLKDAFKKTTPVLSPDDTIYLAKFYEYAINYRKHIRRDDISLEQLKKTVSDFCMWQKARILCEIVNREIIYGRFDEAAEKQYDAQLNELTRHDPSLHVGAYLDLYQLLKTHQAVYFDKIQAYLRDYHKYLNKQVVREWSTHLFNFCARRLNEGKDNYAAKLISYIDEIERQYPDLYPMGIDLGRLQSYVLACWICDDIEKAENFVTKHETQAQKLKLAYKLPFYDLYWAMIETHKKNWDKSFAHIKEFKFSPPYHNDIFSKLACDKLLLRYYIETDQVRTAKKFLTEFRNYLNRARSIPAPVRDKMLRFVKLLRKVLRGETVDMARYSDQLYLFDRSLLTSLIEKRVADQVSATPEK